MAATASANVHPGSTVTAARDTSVDSGDRSHTTFAGPRVSRAVCESMSDGAMASPFVDAHVRAASGVAVEAKGPVATPAALLREEGRSRDEQGPSALPDACVGSHTHRMIVDEGLELLTEDEARELLAEGQVGRVGITIGALPAIFPVNYRIIDGAIVFRTSPGSKMSAAARGAVVAFEVDDYQLADRSGWSVLAVGPSEVIHDVNMTFKVLDAGLEPLVDGQRTAIVRIEPTLLSGRRIVHKPEQAIA